MKRLFTIVMIVSCIYGCGTDEEIVLENDKYSMLLQGIEYASGVTDEWITTFRSSGSVPANDQLYGDIFNDNTDCGDNQWEMVCLGHIEITIKNKTTTNSSHSVKLLDQTTRSSIFEKCSVCDVQFDENIFGYTNLGREIDLGRQFELKSNILEGLFEFTFTTGTVKNITRGFTLTPLETNSQPITMVFF